MLARALPLFFVLIWSTGFIAARLVAPYSDPLTFLCYRYALTVVAFVLIALAVGAPWPRGLRTPTPPVAHVGTSRDLQGPRTQPSGC